MKFIKTAIHLTLAFGAASAVATAPAVAQDAESWPNRDVRIVVPYPPGGLTDTVTRVVAEELSKEIGQSVVVENKPGANGQIGLNEVINAPKDGYTIGLVVPATMITLPLTNPNYKIKPLEQLEPLTVAVDTFLTLVVAPNLGVKDVKEFVELGKTKELMYGVPGVGSSFHFNNVMMAKKLGFAATSVPYAGESPILIDVAGSHLDYALVSNAGKAYIEGNKVVPLAVTSKKRVSSLPEIPTFMEMGVDFASDGWVGYIAAKGTPDALLDKMSAAIAKAVKSESVSNKLSNMGYTVVGSSRAEFRDIIENRGRTYSDVIKSGDIVLKDE